MYLLDSNILIYSSRAEHAHLREYITSTSVVSAVSIATVIEVLGYHKLLPKDKAYFEACFAVLHTFDVDKDVSDKAIELRQQQKLSLGDAIIAATAIVHDCELITRNTSDFKEVSGLQISNPFEEQ